MSVVARVSVSVALMTAALCGCGRLRFELREIDGPDGGPGGRTADGATGDGTITVDGCIPETTEAFCTRHGAECGRVTAEDNCGTMRADVACGTCATGAHCSQNTCCEQSLEEFCTALGSWCGSTTGTDACGDPWTANCGDCYASSCNTETHRCVSRCDGLTIDDATDWVIDSRMSYTSADSGEDDGQDALAGANLGADTVMVTQNPLGCGPAEMAIYQKQADGSYTRSTLCSSFDTDNDCASSGVGCGFNWRSWQMDILPNGDDFIATSPDSSELRWGTITGVLADSTDCGFPGRSGATSTAVVSDPPQLRALNDWKDDATCTGSSEDACEYWPRCGWSGACSPHGDTIEFLSVSVSPDGLSLFLMVRIGGSTKRFYESQRDAVGDQFPRPRRLDQSVFGPYEVFADASYDRLTVFVRYDWDVFMLTRPHLSAPFEELGPPGSTAAFVTDFLRLTVLDQACTSFAVTVAPGGCAKEDIAFGETL